MADKKSKHPENVPGRFYVDESCIICALCVELAPNNFVEEQIKSHYSFVYKQPENAEEESACIDAMNQCPVNAIGNDGLDAGHDAS